MKIEFDTDHIFEDDAAVIINLFLSKFNVYVRDSEADLSQIEAIRFNYEHTNSSDNAVFIDINNTFKHKSELEL